MAQITFHHDTVLSDIHLLLPNTRHLMTRLNSAGQPVFVSKFKILSDKDNSDQDRTKESENTEKRDEVREGGGVMEALLDEDGDLDVPHRPRRESPEMSREPICPIILHQSDSVVGSDDDYSDEDDDCLTDSIKIEHTMATPLDDVGKQVWRGAFLLADFILSNPLIFTGSTVLELGAGTGFTSIVMATSAKTVYCTDVGDDLLSMCRRNVTLNKHLTESPGAEVKVRRLDWLQTHLCTDGGDEFSWMEEEVADLYDHTDFIIAADVCYDDDLTDGLFRTLSRLCCSFKHACAVYIAIEKRMNFTLRHLDVSCEAYDHFRRRLSELRDIDDGRCRFSVTELRTDFRQSLVYERIRQLELWKVTSTPVRLSTASDSGPTPS